MNDGFIVTMCAVSPTWCWLAYSTNMVAVLVVGPVVSALVVVLVQRYRAGGGVRVDSERE